MKLFSSLFSTIAEKSSGTKQVVGIDIGSSSIKVVELQEKDNVISLTTYGELQLGPYNNMAIGQSVSLDPKKEQQALVDIIRESAVKAKNGVFAMPLSSSFVTVVNFNAPQDEDISSRIRVEARKYIPIPIGEVTLDWAEIDSGNEAEADNRDVLVAAIQNKALNRFNILMRFINLKEPPTEIECFSSIRGVYNEQEKNIAIVDIGATVTKLYIAKSGLLQRMHRVQTGGAMATKKIAGALNVQFEEAEIAKRNITKSSENFRDMQYLHHGVYERAWGEFRQVIKDYEKVSSTKLDAVYLTGGGSIFPTTRLFIQDSLQRDVSGVDIFNKVSYPAFMEDMLEELNPTFHIALGAALRVFE